MRDEMWNVINLTHYPQSKIYFYLSCPDFLAPAEEEKAWVMLAYITPASVITAKKKKKKKGFFPTRGFFLWGTSKLWPHFADVFNVFS